jgi:hypothetical protein
MARGNSRNDPRFLDAVAQTRAMMNDLAASVRVAGDVFSENPYWLGEGNPTVQAFDPYVPDAAKTVLINPESKWETVSVHVELPKSLEKAALFHAVYIEALARRLEAGWVAETHKVWKDGDLHRVLEIKTSRLWLDQVRGELRYDWRLDNAYSPICQVFGLTRHFSRSKSVFQWKNGEWVTEYAVPQLMCDWLARLSASVKAVLEWVMDALTPLAHELTDRDAQFLVWMRERNWLSNQSDINKFLTDRGLPGGGQLPGVCKTFCAKLGPPLSRAPWQVRPIARGLVK